MKSNKRKRLSGFLALWLGASAVFQATTCQTTAEEVIAGFLTAAVTDLVNGFVFDQFGVIGF